MLGKIADDVKDVVVGWVRSIGDALLRLVDPARTAATPLAGAARDAVRPRSELVAKNALLRQQLIVLRRKRASQDKRVLVPAIRRYSLTARGYQAGVTRSTAGWLPLFG